MRAGLKWFVSSPGEVVIAPGVEVWPHQLKCAQALAASGDIVRFLRGEEEGLESVPSIYIAGSRWVLCSPEINDGSHVRKVLRKALSREPRIVFDAQRVKGLSDAEVVWELAFQAELIKQIEHLKFITHDREVVDVK